MAEDPHPVDDALRRIAGNPEPTEDDFRVAEALLADAISTEKKTRTRTRHRLRIVVAVAVVLAIVGFVAAVDVFRASPTEAAIEEIARATENLQPLNAPDGSFIYTQSEMTRLIAVPREGLEVDYDDDYLVYLLPSTRESWIGDDNTVQIRTTNHAPSFFTTSDRETYYTAELDQQNRLDVEVTETVTLEDPTDEWPTDINALDRAITAASAGRDRPQAVEYLDVALDLLNEARTTPQQRANTLRLIKDLPGLDLRAPEASGQSTFSIEYTDQGIDTRLTFTLNPGGFLIFKEIVFLEANPALGTPSDTPLETARHSEGRVVDGLGSKP